MHIIINGRAQKALNLIIRGAAKLQNIRLQNGLDCPVTQAYAAAGLAQQSIHSTASKKDLPPKRKRSSTVQQNSDWAAQPC
jgi:hypothetical protein